MLITSWLPLRLSARFIKDLLVFLPRFSTSFLYHYVLLPFSASVHSVSSLSFFLFRFRSVHFTPFSDFILISLASAFASSFISLLLISSFFSMLFRSSYRLSQFVYFYQWSYLLFCLLLIHFSSLQVFFVFSLKVFCFHFPYYWFFPSSFFNRKF